MDPNLTRPADARGQRRSRAIHPRVAGGERRVRRRPPRRAYREAVRAWGEQSGRDVDKFDRDDVAVEVGETGVPLLAGAAANFECSIDGRLATGDHTIFAGEIVAAHVDPSVHSSLYDRGVSDDSERFVALGPGDLHDRSQ
ncbi:MAG: flavin reductase family protein [Halococcoides sp.]